MDKSVFKASDIRGKYPREINGKLVFEIAKKLARRSAAGIIVVGRDARLSSPSLYKSAIKGLKAGNFKIKIISAGIMTTPMLYFLINYFNAMGGIMVTASHNPKEYNGLKIVGKRAVPISGKEIYEEIY